MGRTGFVREQRVLVARERPVLGEVVRMPELLHTRFPSAGDGQSGTQVRTTLRQIAERRKPRRVLPFSRTVYPLQKGEITCRQRQRRNRRSLPNSCLSPAASDSVRPKPNTHDTNRKVIISRVGGGPVTNRVPPVTKTITSINSIS